VRAQMAALAEKNGYPRGVALAMVDQDVELLEVYVADQMRVVTASELPAVEREARQQGATVEKGPVISAKGKLLTLTAGEAERYGVSSGTVDDLGTLWQRLGVSPQRVTALVESLPDRIVGFITSGVVTGILVLIALVALYLEITSPGFGVPGTVAIIAFAIVFLGGALLGTVGSLELILFLLGVALLVVEIFLIPGFGLTGASGIVLMLAALVLSRQFFVIPKVGWQWDLLLRNLRDLGLAFLGSIIVMLVIFRFFRRAPLLKRLILETSQQQGEGYTVQDEQEGGRLLGRRGVAVTILRPAGKAEIDGEILAVETDGEFLPAGASVEVVEVSGNRVVVRGL
jgi:membrane-bound serine protease (ClpP class)